MIRRIYVFAALVSVIALWSMASASGGTVPLHQHYITTPNGEHKIGLGFCQNADNFLATGNPTGRSPGFQNLHHNVHVGQANVAFDNPINPVDIHAHGC